MRGMVEEERVSCSRVSKKERGSGDWVNGTPGEELVELVTGCRAGRSNPRGGQDEVANPLPLPGPTNHCSYRVHLCCNLPIDFSHSRPSSTL